MSDATVLVFNRNSGWMGDSAGHKAAARESRPPDLTATLKQLWRQLLKLDGIVDGIATSRGQHFVEVPDEPPAPQFAVPTSPWSANDDGQDGRARGDVGIEERRRELDLRRRIEVATKKERGAPVADKGKWAAKREALERELDDLLSSRREEKVERDFGMGDSPGGRPTGV